MMRRIGLIAMVLAVLVTSGCATRFSPDMIREVIQEQSGSDPRSAFELSLGRFSTLLLKSTLAAAAADPDADLPFAGIDKVELAVYEVPADAVQAHPAIDVTQIPIRGWDPVLRFHDERRSGTVLIQGTDTVIKDLVVVGAGPRQVVYGRIEGALSADLPQALARVLQDGGPEALRESFNEFATASEP